MVRTLPQELILSGTFWKTVLQFQSIAGVLEKSELLQIISKMRPLSLLPSLPSPHNSSIHLSQGNFNRTSNWSPDSIPVLRNLFSPQDQEFSFKNKSQMMSIIRSKLFSVFVSLRVKANAIMSSSAPSSPSPCSLLTHSVFSQIDLCGRLKNVPVPKVMHLKSSKPVNITL